MGIKVKSLSKAIGAYVDCGDLLSCSQHEIDEIKFALLKYHVLLFRGTSFKPSDLMKIGGYFGLLEKPPLNAFSNRIDGLGPYVMAVSNIHVNGVPIGTLGSGDVVWHSDYDSYTEPPSTCVLNAHEIPEGDGGKTGFINMQLAAMTLPTHLQDAVFGKMIYHDGSKNSAGSSRLNPQSCSHPIIVSHPETGLDTLYLGRKFGCFVEGESAENSAALLDELWQHVEAQPSWFHQWDVGDTLVWDNRSTLHCRTSFNEDCGRLLYRVQTAGSKPQPSALFY